MQDLHEIQAPTVSVKPTANALVKVDSTFLPGITIGTSHWVAYAMTKGEEKRVNYNVFVLTVVYEVAYLLSRGSVGIALSCNCQT